MFTYGLYFYSPIRAHLYLEAMYRWLVRLGDRLPQGLLEKCSRCTASKIEALSRLVDACFAGASIPAATSSFPPIRSELP
jgi:hypothetical protein